MLPPTQGSSMLPVVDSEKVAAPRLAPARPRPLQGRCAPELIIKRKLPFAARLGYGDPFKALDGG